MISISKQGVSRVNFDPLLYGLIQLIKEAKYDLQIYFTITKHYLTKRKPRDAGSRL